MVFLNFLLILELTLQNIKMQDDFLASLTIHYKVFFSGFEHPALNR